MDAVRTRLEQLTDERAREVLNVVLKGQTETNPTFTKLLLDENGLEQALNQIEAAVGRNVAELSQASRRSDGAQCRELLLLLSDSEWRGAVEGALQVPPSRLEPVTSMLVAAGVLLLLSTKVKFEFSEVGGRREIHVQVEKTATPAALIQKLLARLQ